MSQAPLSKRGRALLVGALIALSLAAYWPTLDNGFIWDDDDYVTENPTLHSADGLRQIWFDYGATPQYYPMVHTTFWVEYQLWRLHPTGYHLVNLLLHALAAGLLFAVLRALRIPGAWFAAAIFAVHPVHVESVAWVTERKNVLSGAFYLASLLAYLRSAGLSNTDVEARRASQLYALSLLLFVAALLSKTVTGSLPAVILLLVWYLRGRVRWWDVWPLVPYFVLAGGFGLLTAQLETQHVGAVGWEWNLSFADRVLIAGRALWFYAAKLLWPVGLTFNYPRFEIVAGDPTAWLYPAAAAAVVISLFLMRARIGRGPLVAVLIFAGTLFPALGFFDVYPMRYSFVADHYQYLASIGLIVLFAAATAGAAQRLVEGRRAPRTIAAAVILVALATLTWRQSHVYRDLDTLWSHTLAENPGSWLALGHLGTMAADRGELDVAIDYYRASLGIEARQHEAHNNLGNALRLRGELPEAAAAVARSIGIRPDYTLAHNSLGLIRHDQGRYPEAIASFERALAIDPAFAAAHTNLGITLVASGDPEGAIRHHRSAIELAPDLTAPRTNLAAVWIDRGEFDLAIEQLSRVLELDPDSPIARKNLIAARKLRAAGRDAHREPARPR